MRTGNFTSRVLLPPLTRTGRHTSACALLVVLKARATKVLAEIMSMASALKSGVENAPISVRLTSVSTSRPFIRAPHKHSMSDVKPALGVSLFEDGPAPINAAVGATTHSTSTDVGSMHVQFEKIRDPVHVLRYTKKAAVRLPFVARRRKLRWGPGGLGTTKMVLCEKSASDGTPEVGRPAIEKREANLYGNS